MSAAHSPDSNLAALATTSAASVPLIGHTSGGDVFAYRHGKPVSAAHFLRDVEQLALSLPHARWVINLAADRYLFAVGLGAALSRRQITLLPSNHTPNTIATLLQEYPGTYALTDGLRPHAALPYHEIPSHDTPAAVDRFNVPTIPHDQIALILFTSGSTGVPVPTRKQWGPFLHSVVSEAEGLNLHKCKGLSVLGTVPAQHSYGLESTVLLPMLTGQALDSGKPFYPADVCNALNALPRPRMLVTTPIHLRALMRSQLLCPQVDVILSATAPLSIDLAREAEERFRAPMMEIYGCSEAGQLATRHATATNAWTLMRGVLLTQSGDTTSVSGGHVPGVVTLADVIEVIDAEHFVLHGRGADVINIAGKRTSLGFLNHQLLAIEGIEDGAFFMPEEHDQDVTRLIAFVVAPHLSETAILRALRERIDAVFLPRPLWRVDRLPRNSAGKLPRENLVALAAELKARPQR